MIGVAITSKQNIGTVLFNFMHEQSFQLNGLYLIGMGAPHTLIEKKIQISRKVDAIYRWYLF
jgi:hypothetical protein